MEEEEESKAVTNQVSSIKLKTAEKTEESKRLTVKNSLPQHEINFLHNLFKQDDEIDS